ncbi:uncharacterized protein LOC114277629 [Camellia sinensis]|uniref:uncharacterized protein LOC114277629 n=1 Tax=Camellia sinensis TaxID=4442 RepID=UPI001035C01D|nr:uncharacterized protein LOC114277629 [Camellia sinensis]XP_028075345.1 uncharacterized protein LOC114277629 [Camellia sinensis]XP_028075346.1 uncharacterized protein LOC114277629 [Camellia sinensis]XP_028075347.1 uncharacterized protein LOC114277629 [Camellia sinensis]
MLMLKDQDISSIEKVVTKDAHPSSFHTSFGSCFFLQGSEYTSGGTCDLNVNSFWVITISDFKSDFTFPPSFTPFVKSQIDSARTGFIHINNQWILISDYEILKFIITATRHWC